MLKPTKLTSIPATTKRVAKAAFPKGSTVMDLRDAFGTLYENEDFASLFPNTGQPAYEPWRLASVTVFQFLENLTDRQAADAVRGRLDWKYALSLKLEDPGFDRSVLSEFRARLIQGNMEQVLLDKILERFKEKGLLKSTKQRTDSTHVVAAVRQLRRLELVGETMRAALNAIAAAEPEWLRGIAKPEWFERYSHRVEEYRFPKGKNAQRAYGDSVAQDGLELLTLLEQPDTPDNLNTLSMVKVLKAVWQQNFEIQNGNIRWLTPAELKPSGERFNSPYDTEAFYSTRRETEWIGYKVHVSETCEADALRVITHVQTTASVMQDVSVTADIHQALADKALLPEMHVVDTGYTDAELLATSQAEHRVRLIGPVRENLSWQAKAAQGFSQNDFVLDWDKEQAVCPQGKLSYRWEQKTNNYGLKVTHVKFRSRDCQACSVRSLCTKSTTNGRRLSLQAKESQAALQAMRVFMASDEGKSLYACRAGIEGTLSQGVRKMGLRFTRYRGLKKTHLQHLATAAAINVTRTVNWLRGDLPVTSKISPFARLARVA